MLDLYQVREKFPEWSVTSVWTSASSGPDFRRLFAWRDGVTLSAASEGELVILLERAESGP